MTTDRLLVEVFELDEDSPVLGWQARLVTELARRSDVVAVVADRVGSFAAPVNVEVLECPPPALSGVGRLARLASIERSVRQMVRRVRPSACFVHMHHRALVRDAAVLRSAGIPTLMWYAHGSTSRSLRMAERLASRIVTSSPEGFRLPSSKVRVIGQGIDLAPLPAPTGPLDGDIVVTTGRISPRKHPERVLDVADAVRELAPSSPVRFRIVGPCLDDKDARLAEALRSRIATTGQADRVEILPPVATTGIAAVHADAFAHLNVAETGSMDKTVLEALALGIPVITSNPGFRTMLAEAHEAFVDTYAPADVARQIVALHDRRASVDRRRLRDLVEGSHDLVGYVDRLEKELDDMILECRR